MQWKIGLKMKQYGCNLNNLPTYSNYYKVIINEYYIVAGLLKKYKMLSIGNVK